MDQSTALIALSRALDIIAKQVPLETFDPPILACTVSALVPLYAVEGAHARPLCETDLRGALFTHSGGAVSFRDGRPTIENLAVASDTVGRVIRVLQGATLQLESSHG